MAHGRVGKAGDQEKLGIRNAEFGIIFALHIFSENLISVVLFVNAKTLWFVFSITPEF